jgi:hypothetical protein
LVPDGVELGYKPIYQTMAGGQRTTRSFVTIFSFLTHLLGLPTLSDPAQAQAVRDAILARAKAENLDLTQVDEYEIATQRLYTVLPLDGTLVTQHGPGPFAGQPLQTRRANDPARENNKLDNYVFFKFTVTDAGTYEFEITPVGQAAMRVTVNAGGHQTPLQASTLGEQLKLVMVLPPGDYTAAVNDASGYTGTGAVPNAVFMIRATKK